MLHWPLQHFFANVLNVCSIPILAGLFADRVCPIYTLINLEYGCLSLAAMDVPLLMGIFDMT